MLKRLKGTECNAAQLVNDLWDEECDGVDDGIRMLKVEACSVWAERTDEKVWELDRLKD